MLNKKPLRVLIAALGGEGGGVLAQWLVEAATQAGFAAQSTSIPGVAQRTGATTYYVEIFPVPIASLGGRQPILGLYPVPGAIDLVIASELLEAGRVVQSAMVSPQRTHLITSTSRTLTTAEKMALGDGRFSSDQLLQVVRTQSRAFTAFDMDAAARGAGTVVSAVMLGGIAGSGVLPIPHDAFEAIIRASGVGVEGSLRGFRAGMAALRETGVIEDAVLPLPAREAGTWPASVAEIADLGYARMLEFQDTRYATLYRERVGMMLAAERAADSSGSNGYALTREAARFLALWMAFDDIVRVAALKCRASRFARVRDEVNAGPDDIVRIIDHFKPGVPEFAGLLPPRVARRVLAWSARRQARGHAVWAIPLHLRADTVTGFLLLRVLAGLRGWRRRGMRYADEQVRIERWWQSVLVATREGWSLAFELALCGRLIKGYGETNERGKRNLAHILDHLATGPGAPATRAQAIRETREAALADEGGKALDIALTRHGAPARPITPQPIRWMRKPVDNARGEVAKSSHP